MAMPHFCLDWGNSAAVGEALREIQGREGLYQRTDKGNLGWTVAHFLQTCVIQPSVHQLMSNA